MQPTRTGSEFNISLLATAHDLAIPEACAAVHTLFSVK
jgi:hypothetical protein